MIIIYQLRMMSLKRQILSEVESTDPTHLSLLEILGSGFFTFKIAEYLESD